MVHRSRPFQKAAVLLLFLVAAGGVPLWLMGRPRPAVHSSLIVPVNHLPAEASVFGARVVLKSAQVSSDGRLRFSMDISGLRTAAGADVIRVGDQKVEGGEFEHSSREFLEPEFLGEADRVETSAAFRLASVPANCTMMCQLYRKRADAKVLFSFLHVSPTRLPMTLSQGDMDATIESAGIETLRFFGAPNMWMPTVSSATWSDYQKPVKVLVLRVRERVPDNRGVTGEFRLTKTGETWKVDGSLLGRSLEAAEAEGVRLKDGAGMVHKLFAYADSGILVHAASDAFAKEVSHRTFVEGAVARVSRPIAGRLITRRALGAARRARQTYTYALAFKMNSVPREFDLDIPITPPPDPKDVVWVTFKDVPITRSP